MDPKVRNRWINILVLLGTVVLCTGALELASRWIFYISPGAITETLDGVETQVFVKRWRLRAGLRYRQYSSEFDVTGTITPEGYRGPRVEGNPDEIFVGDSFTYGTGLSDDETFAYLYAQRTGSSVVNLGHPGTGTTRQVEILTEFFQEQGWRPKRVRLFMLAMVGSAFSGNDLSDVLTHDEQKRNVADVVTVEKTSGFIGNLMLRSKTAALRESNLIRLAKYHFGPQIRAWLTPDVSDQYEERALSLVGGALDRLAQLGDSLGFDPEVFIIHPVQDVLRGTYQNTLAEIRRVAPEGMPVYSTAPLYLDDPPSYYYPFDGHINAAGARKIADYLVSLDAGEAETTRR